jgi:predicted TIM-barrel fold metal-dependent hydrolase
MLGPFSVLNAEGRRSLHFNAFVTTIQQRNRPGRTTTAVIVWHWHLGSQVARLLDRLQVADSLPGQMKKILDHVGGADDSRDDHDEAETRQRLEAVSESRKRV